MSTTLPSSLSQLSPFLQNGSFLIPHASTPFAPKNTSQFYTAALGGTQEFSVANFSAIFKATLQQALETLVYQIPDKKRA